MRTIDIDTWDRKEHYEFFSKYDDPFFGIVTEIDCTKVFQISKQKGQSFFANYIHRSLQAVNAIEAFKLRIHEGKVVIFDTIHASAVIGRTEGPFGFSFTHFSQNFKQFNTDLQKEIECVRASEGLRENVDSRRSDTIYYSTAPWFRFTGIKHPMNIKSKDSVPKIAFGKVFSRSNRMFFAMSIDVHHALMDGIDVGRYIEAFQKLMDE